MSDSEVISKTKTEAFKISDDIIEVRRGFLVEVDSLLSLLVHRHGSYLDKIGELKTAERLYITARAYYQICKGR